MAARRVRQPATRLPNGKALITGGESDGCSGNVCMFIGSLASAEIYDSTAGAFTPTGDMAARRRGCIGIRGPGTAYLHRPPQP